MLPPGIHAVRPAQEAYQRSAVAPRKPPEIARGDAIRVETGVSLDAPPQIRAAPGTQPIPLGEPPHGADHYPETRAIDTRRGTRSETRITYLLAEALA